MKSKYVIPTILTIIAIVVIIFFFVNAKQPYVECSRTTKNEYSQVNEDIVVKLDNNKISGMTLTRKIILNDKYLSEENLDMIENELKKAYRYIDSSKLSFSRGINYVLVMIDVKDDETLILKNIKVSYDNDLNIYINPNTKSSEVVTLKMKDKYSEGEFMTMMKQEGYVCK